MIPGIKGPGLEGRGNNAQGQGRAKPGWRRAAGTLVCSSLEAHTEAASSLVSSVAAEP